jgi:hypothetical protein
MLPTKSLIGIILIALIYGIACTQTDQVSPTITQNEALGETGNDGSAARMGGGGVTTANGWYEEEEIYYILLGVEEGVTERGRNQLYLIGGDRAYQANVALFIPGEPGYSVHWNVNVVHTAPGTTLADILSSQYVSEHYPEALFDDVEDILEAQAAGLVTIDHPGVVVNCPIISEQGAEAPGNTELPEEFPPFPDTF